MGHLASQVNPVSQSGPSGHAKDEDEAKEDTKQLDDAEDLRENEGNVLVPPTQDLSMETNAKAQDPEMRTASQRGYGGNKDGAQGGTEDDIYPATLPDDEIFPIRGTDAEEGKEADPGACNGTSDAEPQQREDGHEDARMNIIQSDPDCTAPAVPVGKKSQGGNGKKEESIPLVEKDTAKEGPKARAKRGRSKKATSKEPKRGDKKMKTNSGLKAKPDVMESAEETQPQTSQKESKDQVTVKGRPKKVSLPPNTRTSGTKAQTEGSKIMPSRKRGIQETAIKPSRKGKQPTDQQGKLLRSV